MSYIRGAIMPRELFYMVAVPTSNDALKTALGYTLTLPSVSSSLLTYFTVCYTKHKGIYMSPSGKSFTSQGAQFFYVKAGGTSNAKNLLAYLSTDTTIKTKKPYNVVESSSVITINTDPTKTTALKDFLFSTTKSVDKSVLYGGVGYTLGSTGTGVISFSYTGPNTGVDDIENKSIKSTARGIFRTEAPATGTFNVTSLFTFYLIPVDGYLAGGKIPSVDMKTFFINWLGDTNGLTGITAPGFVTENNEIIFTNYYYSFNGYAFDYCINSTNDEEVFCGKCMGVCKDGGVCGFDLLSGEHESTLTCLTDRSMNETHYVYNLDTWIFLGILIVIMIALGAMIFISEREKRDSYNY